MKNWFVRWDVVYLFHDVNYAPQIGHFCYINVLELWKIWKHRLHTLHYICFTKQKNHLLIRVSRPHWPIIGRVHPFIYHPCHCFHITYCIHTWIWDGCRGIIGEWSTMHILLDKQVWEFEYHTLIRCSTFNHIIMLSAHLQWRPNPCTNFSHDHNAHSRLQHSLIKFLNKACYSHMVGCLTLWNGLRDGD